MRDDPSGRRARHILGAVVLALFAVSVAYRLLVLQKLEHTSLVFVGIPAFLAFMLLQTRPQTAIGTINKVIAIALCLSGVLFGETLICILLAAPIFFLVGTIVGAAINWIRGRHGPDDPRATRWRATLALTVLPFSVEGVAPGFEFARDEQVTATRIVTASPAAVRDALAATPRFDRALPPFLRIGFPIPVHTSGSGLRVGDRRTIELTHGEHHSGALVLAVSEVDASSVRFAAVSDSSYIMHWLAWQHATVSWEPIDATRTRVTWTLGYRRRLDPAWYFAPLERYGAFVAAGYLIESLAQPAESPRSR
jgi:hypothetical protein